MPFLPFFCCCSEERGGGKPTQKGIGLASPLLNLQTIFAGRRERNNLVQDSTTFFPGKTSQFCVGHKGTGKSFPFPPVFAVGCCNILKERKGGKKQISHLPTCKKRKKGLYSSFFAFLPKRIGETKAISRIRFSFSSFFLGMEEFV